MAFHHFERLDGAIAIDHSLHAHQALNSPGFGLRRIGGPGLRDQFGLLHVATHPDLVRGIQRSLGPARSENARQGAGDRNPQREFVSGSFAKTDGEVFIELLHHLRGSGGIGGTDGVAFMELQTGKQVGPQCVGETVNRQRF